MSSHAADVRQAIDNVTLVCQDPHNTVNVRGFWSGKNPLDSSTSLLLVQLSLITFVSTFVNVWLRHLGQSSIVSNIFSGILFGPSLLGHFKEIANTLFPLEGIIVLETLSTWGLTYFLFSIGVQMDVATMIRPQRKNMVIGGTLFLCTLVLPEALTFLLMHSVPKMDQTLKAALPFVSATQAISSSAVVGSLLTELKMLNTDIGRTAVSTALFCDVVGIIMSAFAIALSDRKSKNTIIPWLSAIQAAALVLGIIYICRPFMVWIRNRSEEKNSVRESHIFIIFVLVLVFGFLSEISSQHYLLGPLVFGFVIPAGPPLGSAVVARVDTLATGLFYPSYLAVTGLKTNIFTINPRSSWVLGIIFLFASLVKIGAVMLAACYYEQTVREAFVLGLILNAKGITELVMYNIWKQTKLLSDQEFALSVIYVVVVTAVVTPLIKLLYDPSRQFSATKRSTIQHLKRDTELRIMACIHSQENVPTLVNILEVSNATEENPVAAIALILVELVGRSTPVLIAHHPGDNLQSSIGSSASTSNQIIKALGQYAECNEGRATLQPFTSISHYPTMHDDIIRVAFEKRAHIVILPFHKHYAIDGTIGSVNRAHQSMNINVLEKAPCSVGILIDRGILSGSMSVLSNQYIYHVAVIFLGGVDDAEALAYGSRMASHPNVDLTVARFLLFGDDNLKDRKRDTDLLEEYRRAHVGNERFVVVEEVVKDGAKLSSVIKSMVDCFDLMLVGMHHQDSPLLSGLGEWSECPELGIVGDMLASPDFRCSLSVLVVQQQRIAGKPISRTTKPVDKEPLIHDIADEQMRSSWTITVNEYDRK
ncbi:cation/H(+) antiporter 15-like [Argentina anserina]|uniref:cation/H(+) antiporter 15-like n=1 Tax=Argentina anserina TaxID=57926 RepID=UPI00217674A4|nr:cation/H(+) antiporter 15-like [Potentilla anserina]